MAHLVLKRIPALLLAMLIIAGFSACKKPLQEGSQMPSATSSKSAGSKVTSRPAPVTSFYEDEKGFPADGIKRRNGLPNITKKLAAGEEVTIAYLGGSITQADGWRVHTDRLLREKYPSAKINMINAGIGGTSSALGVARLERDVLSHNPDLVFVEFLVNTGGIGTGAGQGFYDYSRPTMEAIVRKIWEKSVKTDICIVYTSDNYNRKWLEKGEYTSIAEDHEAVANYYGIPSVIMATNVFDLARNGKLVFHEDTSLVKKADGLEYNSKGMIVFTRDGTHPTDSNSVLYSQVVMDAFDKMPLEKDYAHALPEKLLVTGNRWLNATMADIPSSSMTGFTKIDHPISGKGGNIPGESWGKGVDYSTSGTRFSYVYKGVAGSSITLKFTGTNIGLYSINGKFSGRLHAMLDGKDYGYINMMKKYNVEMTGHSFFFLPDTFAYGDHTLILTVEDTSVEDKYVFSNGAVKREDPEYAKNEVYLGKILICGELKK